MATKGKNSARSGIKTGNKRRSRTFKERLARARENVNREFEARNRSLGNEEFGPSEDMNLYTAIPKGLYRMGKGNLKMLAGAASGLLGFEEGGEVRAMKNGGRALKGTKFKGTF